MRRLRYQVATSLDGYIAGPNGELDWIVQDPDINFSELFGTFDTAVMGRKTFAAMLAQTTGAMPGLDVVVYSNKLRLSLSTLNGTGPVNIIWHTWASPRRCAIVRLSNVLNLRSVG